MDLIDRQEVIDAFDSYILDETTDLSGNTVREVLEKMPSAQPEIIRCKECKHLFEDNKCPLRTWWTHTEDDFCSYAERRTDGRFNQPEKSQIDGLPTIERKTGKWIKRGSWYCCSECGAEMFFAGVYDEDQHYCYNCGSYNGGGDDE